MSTPDDPRTPSAPPRTPGTYRLTAEAHALLDWAVYHAKTVERRRLTKELAVDEAVRAHFGPLKEAAGDTQDPPMTAGRLRAALEQLEADTPLSMVMPTADGTLISTPLVALGHDDPLDDSTSGVDYLLVGAPVASTGPGA